MPAWRLILFLTPCVRKLEIHYDMCESADVPGIRHVLDDIVEVGHHKVLGIVLAGFEERALVTRTISLSEHVCLAT